jgi:hypothetical protein
MKNQFIIEFFSGPPSLALTALPDDAVLAFNVRAFSPDGNCAIRSHRRRGYALAEKYSAASLHLVSICTRRSGTYVEQTDYWVGQSHF